MTLSIENKRYTQLRNAGLNAREHLSCVNIARSRHGANRQTEEQVSRFHKNYKIKKIEKKYFFHNLFSGFFLLLSLWSVNLLLTIVLPNVCRLTFYLKSISSCRNDNSRETLRNSLRTIWHLLCLLILSFLVLQSLHFFFILSLSVSIEINFTKSLQCLFCPQWKLHWI